MRPSKGLKIKSVLNEFNKKVDTSLSLPDDVSKFKEFRDDKFRPIKKCTIYLVTELSFLQLFVALEEFLEDTFTYYLCGTKSLSGNTPKKYVIPSDLQHAHDIVCQGRPYMDWNKWEDIINKANLYFENGEPFNSVIGGLRAELDEMKKIRNRIAHCSKHSEKLFQAVVRQKLGYEPRGSIAPGRFLLMNTPDSGQSILQEYGRILNALGNSICT